MNNKWKSYAKELLKKWWVSLLMIPFMIVSIRQVYWALNYNIFFAVNYDYPFPLNIIYLFIDNFILIVHEAGHTFFGIFGVRFITVLGGSLFQVFLPLLIVLFCWFNRKYIGLQFSLCLLGFSWLDIACYAADGGARQLPLIGGLGKSAHDWHNLLVRMNALDQDMTFGLAFVGVGILCYLWALGVPVMHQQYQSVDIDLDVNE